MELFEALRTRRSIRKYTGEEIGETDLQDILECAMLAPSARNEQPWHFVVVKDQDTLNLASQTSPYTHMARDASVVIVVCGDLDEDKASGMWVQDCAAATQNILLAARGKGLGSVWCGVHPAREREDHLRKTLHLPENIVPFSLICLGYPDQLFAQVNRYKEARIHFNKW